MRWRDYLAVIAALMLVSWLRTIWSTAAEVITAAVVAVVLVIAASRKVLRRRQFRRLATLAEAEREVEVDRLPASDAALARLGFEISFQPHRLAQLPAERRFDYRRGSRSLNTYLFWACIVVAAAMLVPLALGRFDEPSTAIVWAVIAAVTLLSGLGYRYIAAELGAQVLIDRQGIALEGTERNDRRLSWLEISWIRPVAVAGNIYRALVLGNRQGERIVLDSDMPEFNEAVELVAAKLAAIRGAT